MISELFSNNLKVNIFNVIIFKHNNNIKIICKTSKWVDKNYIKILLKYYCNIKYYITINSCNKRNYKKYYIYCI